MYARKIGEQTLTFRVSGKLWGRSLVMGDVETKSEWSHLGGEAMAGKLKGTQLEIIPSAIMSWAVWKRDHPGGTVSTLSRSANEFTRRMYEDEAPRYVLGLVHGETAVCYPLDEMMKAPAINDLIAGDPVLVTYDRQGAGAKIFRRVVNGETLDFTSDDGKLTAGGSRWSVATGEALDGPHKGKRLTPLPSVFSFTRAWVQFHPEGRVYRPQTKKT